MLRIVSISRSLQLQAAVGAPLQNLGVAGSNWSRPLLFRMSHNFRLEVDLRHVPQEYGALACSFNVFSAVDCILFPLHHTMDGPVSSSV